MIPKNKVDVTEHKNVTPKVGEDTHNVYSNMEIATLSISIASVILTIFLFLIKKCFKALCH